MLSIATFKNCRDNQPRQRETTWEDLSVTLMRHAEREEKDGPLWSPTRYKPGTTRAKANVVEVSCLVLDFDSGAGPEDFIRPLRGFAAAMHTTFQHLPEAQRWRVVLPLLTPVPAVEWPHVWEQMTRHFGGNAVDPSCKDASRIYYTPSCPPGAERDAMAQDGEWLDPAGFARPSVPLLVTRAMGHLGEGRNNAGMWLACQLRDNGYTQTEAERADWHQKVSREKVRPDGRVDVYDADEWHENVQKVYASPARQPWRALTNGSHAGRNGTTVEEPPHPARVSGHEWEEPLPLCAVVPPPFPIGALPGWLADQVEAVAIATQTPPDLAGMLTLSVLATAVQKRCEALVRDGWREPLSIWTVTALPPGNRKSPAYMPMVQPIFEYEGRLVENMRAEIAAAQTEQEVMEGSLKRLKDQAIKAKTPFDREEFTRQAVLLAQELERLKVPASPRMIVDDATQERLGMLLAEHGGRMAVISDEGDVFDMMAGRYASGAANIGIYLRGHSGGDVIVDRVGRPALVVRRAAITLGLTVQPDVLLGMTTNPTFKGRGLLGRILYSLPKSTLGEREVRPAALSQSVSALYSSRIARLLAVTADVDEEGRPTPRLIPFSPDADDVVASFESWIEPQLKAGRSLGYMADWAGKLTGEMVRISTLLHMGEMAEVENPWQFPVDPETVHSGRIIAEYLIPHARAAFQAMGTDPALNGAREILEWAKERGLPTFQKRDAHRGLQSVFAKAQDLDPPLIMLCDHGYLRQIDERREGVGRPASPAFELHPDLLK